MILLISHSVKSFNVFFELLFGVMNKLSRYLSLLSQYLEFIPYLLLLHVNSIRFNKNDDVLQWVRSEGFTDFLETTVHKFTLMVNHYENHSVANRHDIVRFVSGNVKEVCADFASHSSENQSFHDHLILLKDCAT